MAAWFQGGRREDGDRSIQLAIRRTFFRELESIGVLAAPLYGWCLLKRPVDVCTGR
jgi:hypothetical protein